MANVVTTIVSQPDATAGFFKLTLREINNAVPDVIQTVPDTATSATFTFSATGTFRVLGLHVDAAGNAVPGAVEKQSNDLPVTLPGHEIVSLSIALG